MFICNAFSLLHYIFLTPFQRWVLGGCRVFIDYYKRGRDSEKIGNTDPQNSTDSDSGKILMISPSSSRKITNPKTRQSNQLT